MCEKWKSKNHLHSWCHEGWRSPMALQGPGPGLSPLSTSLSQSSDHHETRAVITPIWQMKFGALEVQVYTAQSGDWLLHNSCKWTNTKCISVPDDGYTGGMRIISSISPLSGIVDSLQEDPRSSNGWEELALFPFSPSHHEQSLATQFLRENYSGSHQSLPSLYCSGYWFTKQFNKHILASHSRWTVSR